jgi:hypothetical protein
MLNEGYGRKKGEGMKPAVKRNGVQKDTSKITVDYATSKDT